MDARLRRDDNKDAGAPLIPGNRALRLGLRQIKGFAEADAERLVAARGSGFADARDLWRRSGLGRAALERLAAADALRSLDQSMGGLDRRRGLWALKALGDAPLPLFAQQESSPPLRKYPLSPTGGEGRGEGAMRQASGRPLTSSLSPPVAGEGLLQRRAKTAPRRYCRKCRWASMSSSRITRQQALA